MSSAVRPTNVSRVTMLMQTDLLTNGIRSNSVDLLKVQNQLSTGLKIARPSDNPTDASTIMHLDGMLERFDQYLANVNYADDYISATDSALSQAVTLVQQAYTLAQGSIGESETVRQDNATSLASIIDSLVNVANMDDGKGNYIFAGQNTSEAPFKKVDNGIMFLGSTAMMKTRLDADNLQNFSADASEAFGALSSQVVGIADLNPDITANTLLSDLNGALGKGIRLGSILISDGINTEAVDLTNCVTVGDVINKLSGSSVAATVGN
jgi:flagellar hook-associated protein 3 FlgL